MGWSVITIRGHGVCHCTLSSTCGCAPPSLRLARRGEGRCSRSAQSGEGGCGLYGRGFGRQGSFGSFLAAARRGAGLCEALRTAVGADTRGAEGDAGAK